MFKVMPETIFLNDMDWDVYVVYVDPSDDDEKDRTRHDDSDDDASNTSLDYFAFFVDYDEACDYADRLNSFEESENEIGDSNVESV